MEINQIINVNDFENAVKNIVLISVITFLICKLISRRYSGKLPPGPYGLPFLGYSPFLVGGKVHLKLTELGKKYGNIISLRLGTQLYIILNEYKIAKKVLCHHMTLNRSSHLFEPISETGFVTLNDDEWEEQRRFCVRSMKELGLGRGVWQNMIHEEIPEFVGELNSYEGKPVDIRTLLTSAINGNILYLLIGRKLKKGKESRKIQLASELAPALNAYADPSKIATILPFIKKLLVYFKISSFYRHFTTIEDFIDQVTKDAVTQHIKEQDSTDTKDFINLYLDQMRSEETKGNINYFSEKNAIGNLNSLFVASSDTILTSVNWLLRLMAAYPEIQKKVQTELDEIVGKDGKIYYEDRIKIPYTFSVLMESQRFATIAPLPAPRLARATFEIEGYTIPEGTFIMPNIWAMHHDPDYFENPDEFLPERFLEGNGETYNPSKESYMPFSVGRRNCPGETVAWMEIMIFFVSVMQNFTIIPPPNMKVNLNSVPGLIIYLEPQELCFVRR